MPIHFPLRAEEIQQLEAAGKAGTMVLAVLQFLPQDRQWADVLPDVIQRLKSWITHWEVASEPDDPTFGWPADDLKTYASCLLKAASIIKTNDPQALIHNGGLGRSLPKGIAQLCDQGAGSVVDIWNVHPYMNPLMPDAKGCLRYFNGIIRQTLSNTGQASKPLWWSSIACPGMQDPKGTPDWWLGKNPTEIMQAEWFKILYSVAAQEGVERLFWEGWKDHPDQMQTGIDYFGLVRADDSVKPIVNVLGQGLGQGL